MKKSLGAMPLAFPSPVWVIGSYGEEDRPNAATVAWGGMCCSAPPCAAISLRRATLSHGNIVRRGAFTINVATESQMIAADYFGIASGRQIDKIGRAGLHAVRSNLVDAPYLEEFAIVLECQVRQTIEIGSHTQFIGEILDVKIDEAAVNAENKPLYDVIRPIVYMHGDRTYHGVGSVVGPAFSAGKALQE